MKCHEVQESLGVYWDLPVHDPERVAIDRHLQHCNCCMEEFRIWEESEAMIRSAAQQGTAASEPMDDITRSVMDRIYSEQSWMMPIHERRYQISRVFKRNVSAIIACCMAMFVSGFVYFLFGEKTDPSSMAHITGLLDTVNANEGISLISSEFYQEIPVASISDPFVLNVVPTVPQYWVALSILGIIITLLILNWLSRART
ncbi:anti-sigma factor family protein [Paenibacillus sp. GCM10012307]|uniref:Zf-HC2 domain-containing protein n=1 Tax=Paenibacillus roseus TaxID=2798579 RepID=A0A934JAC7_9BACL|nr:hypothetical protein [Paenibacillus roseus]MBJ6363546.1 hypothetical protein [Paenibacillus roseus]